VNLRLVVERSIRLRTKTRLPRQAVILATIPRPGIERKEADLSYSDSSAGKLAHLLVTLRASAFHRWLTVGQHSPRLPVHLLVGDLADVEFECKGSTHPR
jgi:hypothetical protein